MYLLFKVAVVFEKHSQIVYNTTLSSYIVMQKTETYIACKLCEETWC